MLLSKMIIDYNMINSIPTICRFVNLKKQLITIQTSYQYNMTTNIQELMATHGSSTNQTNGQSKLVSLLYQQYKPVTIKEITLEQRTHICFCMRRESDSTFSSRSTCATLSTASHIHSNWTYFWILKMVKAKLCIPSPKRYCLRNHQDQGCSKS